RRGLRGQAARGIASGPADFVEADRAPRILVGTGVDCRFSAAAAKSADTYRDRHRAGQFRPQWPRRRHPPDAQPEVPYPDPGAAATWSHHAAPATLRREGAAPPAAPPPPPPSPAVWVRACATERPPFAL